MLRMAEMDIHLPSRFMGRFDDGLYLGRGHAHPGTVDADLQSSDSQPVIAKSGSKEKVLEKVQILLKGFHPDGHSDHGIDANRQFALGTEALVGLQPRLIVHPLADIGTGIENTCDSLLDHPRRCFIYLFPSQ